MRRLRTRMWFKGATSRQDPGGERVCVCVDLSCSLGNRQQQEKKSLGVIGQRFYPLWPIKLHLCAYKQPIRDLMPSWGDRRISSGNTHTHVYTLGNIIYLCTHKWMLAVMRELEPNGAVLSVCVHSTNRAGAGAYPGNQKAFLWTSQHFHWFKSWTVVDVIRCGSLLTKALKD